MSPNQAGLSSKGRSVGGWGHLTEEFRPSREEQQMSWVLGISVTTVKTPHLYFTSQTILHTNSLDTQWSSYCGLLYSSHLAGEDIESQEFCRI